MRRRHACREQRRQRGTGDAQRWSARFRSAAWVLGLALLLPGSSARAELPEVGAPAQLIISAELEKSGGGLFLGVTAVAVSELDKSRGGEGTVTNIEDMIGRVEGNSIAGTVTTGSAMVGGESFQDFNGVSSVIINSGNNVSIQSSTTVNIVIEGP